ncbi:hypothetical protein AJ81_05135 [Pseudothermotoga hypogea DSM 11164 = NBRC 106472]|uniref:Uncharacterized protein n=2 Tax=Pseudothermotoga hypogea TaxID=57487 RepID=A0A0X1KU64_9THEM|nr:MULTISPECIES: hypothetical protein [Pseudothermotoga]AJC74736.1 hypothetical protein AJ81_05135 [Pseudothermotoga hypogea DSM 11164 = NBRC 106472]MBC7123382.1 hypothetical protein [Pseudothermotoga sp.]MDI6861936.1 hypothetical protein [Pseudothermotoga sp.]
MTQKILEIFKPKCLYRVDEGPLGENVYVVVVNEGTDVEKKFIEFYNQVGTEPALIVVTEEEFAQIEPLLGKGEKLF